MNELQVTLAIGDYDHVRDLTAGRTPVPGMRVRAIHLPVEEIFARFSAHREWEVSEFSFGKFVSLVAAGDRSLVGLPVFPSRVFRYSSIYVRGDAPFERPEELAGRRIGVPEWAQTAAVYTRGILHHRHGVELSGVHWVQAGVNEPGRKEKVAVTIPPGVSLKRVADRSLNEMLIAGELDAVLSARPPAGFSAGQGEVRRLIEDYPAMERSYYERTGVFPIMHVLVMQARLHEAYPWAARNLCDAFEQAKRASVRRLLDATASWVPLPWTSARAEDAVRMFGSDPWPYGIEPNRATLETFLRYAHEQGVCARPLEPEELFVPATLTRVKV